MGVTHLVVVVPEADADGAAGPGQHRRHGVEVDEHVCHSLQDELLVHDALETLTKSGHWLRSPEFCHGELRRFEASFRGDHMEQLVNKTAVVVFNQPTDLFHIKVRIFCG